MFDDLFYIDDMVRMGWIECLDDLYDMLMNNHFLSTKLDYVVQNSIRNSVKGHSYILLEWKWLPLVERESDIMSYPLYRLTLTECEKGKIDYVHCESFGKLRDVK